MSSARVVDGTAVAVVDDRLGEVMPAAVAPVLRRAASVYAEEGLAPGLRSALEAPAPPEPQELVERAAQEPVVLVTGEPLSAPAEALRAAGAALITAESPRGVELLDAVTVMDRLRSPGGCPWDAEQDHDSLRTYLVEEAYELLDAIDQRDRDALREELGDVLLQVLFHARIAAEDEREPFGIDEVAAALVSKLVSRHPHVFTDDESVHDSDTQQVRWEELKQREKSRESIVDGVAMGQPAIALAAKLAQRAHRAGIPLDLLPQGESVGPHLFATAAEAKIAGADPEDALRAVAVEFAEQVRSAERRARGAGRDASALSAGEWRFWMSALSDQGNRPTP